MSFPLGRNSELSLIAPERDPSIVRCDGGPRGVTAGRRGALEISFVLPVKVV